MARQHPGDRQPGPESLDLDGELRLEGCHPLHPGLGPLHLRGDDREVLGDHSLRPAHGPVEEERPDARDGETREHEHSQRGRREGDAVVDHEVHRRQYASRPRRPRPLDSPTVSRIVWVDVFAPTPMSGNPLAVVLEADDDASHMQALAAELGLSETVFVLPARAPEAAARLRIFTPARELPVAGHPVVGAAWVMHTVGAMGPEGLLETGVGPLPVRVSGQVATMVQAPPTAGPLVDAAEAAAACGVRAAEHPPAQVWSTGVPQLMLPVADAEALAAARPDPELLARLGARDGWLGVSLFAVTGREGARAEARVRHFAPGVGVPEDPATGSAAGGLGACLAAAGMGEAGALELVVRQGVEMGRPGEIAVRVSLANGVPRRVQVGGRVLPLFQGRLVRP